MRRIAVVAAFVGLLVAIEQTYEHPTFGRGLKALWAAIQFGEVL